MEWSGAFSTGQRMIYVNSSREPRNRKPKAWIRARAERLPVCVSEETFGAHSRRGTKRTFSSPLFPHPESHTIFMHSVPWRPCFRRADRQEYPRKDCPYLRKRRLLAVNQSMQVQYGQLRFQCTLCPTRHTMGKLWLLYIRMGKKGEE